MTRSLRVAAALVAVAAIVVGTLLLTRAGGPSTPGPSVSHPKQFSRTPAQRPAPALHGPLGAHLIRRVQLRESPGGRVVHTLGVKTEYGSDQVLAVVAQKPGWLGVLSPFMPNSQAGWIPAASAQLRVEPYELHVDLSARSLVVRKQGRVVRRITVAVGRPGEETPTGRYAITDLLRVSSGGGPYGCCALALTGRQPHVAQGWTGGDRIAIHGTSDPSSIGTPVSGGCMRAAEDDMRWLMARMSLGTPVRIQA
jgi:lipoprotein-anchoring transpeptidase ErfK/SrfK